MFLIYAAYVRRKRSEARQLATAARPALYIWAFGFIVQIYLNLITYSKLRPELRDYAARIRCRFIETLG